MILPLQMNMSHLMIKAVTKGWVSMRHCDYNCVRKAIDKTKRQENTKYSEAKPWLKWLVASLSLLKATSDPRQILLGHVIACERKSDTWTGFHQSTLVSPCHFHSTNDPQPLTDLLLKLHNCSKWQLHYTPTYIYASPDGKAHTLNTS